MLHYLHDSTIPPKSHFCPIIYQSPIGPMGLKLRMLKDLAYLNGMPFTALQNSYWFGTYEFFKFAKSSLKFFLSSFFLSNASVRRTFDQLLVIVGSPNLVHSFFAMLYRDGFWKIPKFIIFSTFFGFLKART